MDCCDLFAGLRVSAKEELCKERMNKYSVVFFSLKDVDGNWFSNALEDIQRIFSSVVIEHEYLLTSKTVNFADKNILARVKENRATDNELKNFLMILTRSMRYHHDKNVIVLLDEYDAPVAMAAEKVYYREMIHFMKGFFSSALKNKHEQYYVCILTGCLRITGESLFSDLNNLNYYDISETKYADIFGFTQD